MYVCVIVNRFYLVFEKMEGGSLMDALEQSSHVGRGGRRSRRSETEARHVIHDIAVGLQFLHQKGRNV